MEINWRTTVLSFYLRVAQYTWNTLSYLYIYTYIISISSSESDEPLNSARSSDGRLKWSETKTCLLVAENWGCGYIPGVPTKSEKKKRIILGIVFFRQFSPRLDRDKEWNFFGGLLHPLSLAVCRQKSVFVLFWNVFI